MDADPGSRGAADSVSVTVLGNAVPVADAGPDQVHRGGGSVYLDGAASLDPDGSIASYAWVQTGGIPVTLSGADSPTPSFTSARVSIDEVLSFTLTVTDARGATASDSVGVLLHPNAPPIANAGADQTVAGGAFLTLDGSGSIDPEGLPLAYQWTQQSGPTLDLGNAAAAQVSFTAPYVGAPTVFAFALTVTDDFGVAATDTVAITVQPSAPGRDLRPPRSRLRIDRDRVNGDVIYTVRVVVNEPASVYLRQTQGGVAGPWQIYSTPLIVNGGTTLEYYAVDAAGNVEAVDRRYFR